MEFEDSAFGLAERSDGVLHLQGDYSAQPAGESLCQGTGKEAPANRQTSDSGGIIQISESGTVNRLFTHAGGSGESGEIGRDSKFVCGPAEGRQPCFLGLSCVVCV